MDTKIMYRVAGDGESVDNAKQTVRIINAFETKKIITMSLMMFSGTELEKMINRDDFVQATKTERLTEIKTLLEELDPKKEMIFDTTHATNIINIKGKLPQEKKMLLGELSKLGV